jgi:hypothetical protein
MTHDKIQSILGERINETIIIECKGEGMNGKFSINPRIIRDYMSINEWNFTTDEGDRLILPGKYIEQIWLE